MIIKVIRTLLYVISFLQIVMYFFSGQNDIVRENIILYNISLTTLYGTAFFYLFFIILLISNCYKFFKYRTKKTFYFLLLDTIYPLLSNNLYDSYFSQIRT